MKITKLLLFGVSALAVASLMSGCAQKPAQAACDTPDFCKPQVKVKVKIKKVPVSECAKRVKTVVYKGICKHCNGNFPVSVRENSCCEEGACR